MHIYDIRVLKTLAEKECVSELKSLSIFQLLSSLQCSYSKAHNTLSSLVLAELVAKGFKNCRADTYYITEKGIERLRRLR